MVERTYNRKFKPIDFGLPEDIQKQLDEYGKSLRFRKNQWLDFLGWFMGGSTFIREFAAPGMGGRFIVEDIDQLRRQIGFTNYYAYETKQRIASPFVSVNAYREKGMLFKCSNPKCKVRAYMVGGNCPKCGSRMNSRMAPKYDTVMWHATLFDFDMHPPKEIEKDTMQVREWVLSGGIEPAYNDAMTMADKLYEMDVQHFITCTGGKGFQIWSEYQPDVRSWPLVKSLQHIDTSTLNDIARVARPPYTLHPSTYLFCTHIPRQRSFDQILSDIQKCPIQPWRFAGFQLYGGST